MSKVVSIKVPGGYKEIKATMFFESEYQGEKFYVLLGSGEVFALKDDNSIGFINVILPNKNSYMELLETINNKFKSGSNLNDKLIPLSKAPSVVWLDVPFEELHDKKNFLSEFYINKGDYSREQHFYLMFSLFKEKITDFPQAFTFSKIIENGHGYDEAVFENRIDLLKPYFDEIKDKLKFPFLNLVITIKDGKVSNFYNGYSYSDALRFDDEQRFFLHFVPCFDEKTRNEIEQNDRVSIVGDFAGKKITQKEYRKIFSDGLWGKRTLITNGKIFEPNGSNLSKYRK